MSYRRALLTICVMSIIPAISAQRAAAGDGDVLVGGLLYDKWYEVIFVDPPAGDHPLYPPEGAQSGSSTFRCKECHGWDYKGAAGAYGPGSSHYTGIPGVLGSTLSPAEMFDLIKFDDIPNGHGYGAYGLSDEEINHLVAFVQTALIDTDLYIDENKQFLGDEVQGETNYATGGGVLPFGCSACHGPDGTWINFGSLEDPEWVGTIAVANPWELMHKIRFGQPGNPMPGWVQYSGPTQGVADIGLYAQLSLPTAPCDADTNGDGFVDPQDLAAVLGAWGSDPGGPPDINGDGTVDPQDLAMVLGNWGPCP